MASRNVTLPNAGVRRLYEEFLDDLRARLQDPGTDRGRLCRDTLMRVWFGDGADYDERVSDPALPLATRSLVASMDPANVTLEPEYYGEMDVDRYYRVKPLLWLWQMFDHSPLGHNLDLSFRVRRLLARQIFARCGENFRCFRGVEFSFGYNMHVGDNVTFHRFVLIDDRGPVHVGDNVSISDWANVYSHTHDVEDIHDVRIRPTRLDDNVRVTYHATVLAGVQMGKDSMIGSVGVATKDIPPYHVNVGIPAKPVKIKEKAKRDPGYAGPYELERPPREIR
jgi:acetyltransferase-like isoleucine patch superfamily enzyme